MTTNKYYFRVFAECDVDCYLKANNKRDALLNMKKILNGDAAGITFNFDGIDLGSLISVVRMEKILKRDTKTGKRPRNKVLQLSEEEWKIFDKK